METKANYVLVGVFTLLVLLASFAFIYWAAKVDDRIDLVPVTFKIRGVVTGLAAGSEVRFNGIKVGKVDRVEFNVEDPRIVFAHAQIGSDTPIRSDTDASVASAGLTGISYISLKGGDPKKQPLLSSLADDEVPVIDARASAVSDILETVQDVASKANRTLASVEGLIETNREPISQAVKNVETFSASLARNADGVDEFLESASGLGKTIGELSDKLDGTIKGVEDIVTAVDPQKVRTTIDNVESFSQNLKKSGDQVDTLIASVEKISGDLQTFSTNLNVSLKKLDGVLGAVETEKVKATVDDISAAASNARKVVADVQGVTTTINNRKQEIDRIIVDAGEMAKRLNESSKRVDGVLAKLDSFLGTGDAGSIMSDARDTLTEFRSVAANLNRRIDQISGGINQFTNTGLKDVQGLVNDTRRSIARIDRVINNLERDPSGFLFGGSDVKTYKGRPRR